MKHNSIVIELNAAMAQLHKKCNFANCTLIFSFKVLLRRNFDVMFITKNHLYQLIKEDCN